VAARGPWRAGGNLLRGSVLALAVACGPFHQAWSPPALPPASSPVRAEVPAEARLQYARGVTSWLEGDLEAARRSFEAALLLDPHSAELLVALGRLAADAGNEAEARQRLEAALREDASNIEAGVALGDLLLDGDPTAAVRVFRDAIDRGAGDDAWDGLVKALAQSGQVDEARRKAAEWAQRPQTDPFTCFRRGALRYTLGDSAGAQDDVGRFLVEGPDELVSRDVYVDFFIDISRAANRFRSALVLLDRLSDMEPGNATLANRLAFLAEDRNDALRALHAWSRLDRLRGDHDAFVKVKLGQTLVDLGRGREALAVLDEARRVDSALPGLNRWRAQAALASGQPALAVSILGGLRADLSEDEVALLADALVVQGRTAAARKVLDAGVNRLGASDALVHRLEVIDLRSGQEDSARAWAEQLPETSAPGRLFDLALAAEESGKIEIALRILTEGELEFPAQEVFAIEHGRLLLKDHKAVEAAVVLEAAYGRLPRNVQILRLLGYAATQTGPSPEKALSWYRQACTFDPTDAGAANDLAWTLEENGGNLVEAEAFAKISVELEPANGSYLDTLGWITFRRGQAEPALELLREAIDYEPDEPAILQHLVTVCQALGRESEAAQAEIRLGRLKAGGKVQEH
jgi:tetratricopeptide (TPR) repeat protein